MIIWRGWGILALVLTLAGLAIGAAIRPVAGAWAFGLGLLLGGIGTIAVGYWLNQTRPTQKAEAFRAEREPELARVVEAGQYRPQTVGRTEGGRYVPPQELPLPRSLEEAKQLAARQLDAEVAHVKGQLTNAHSLFFVPLQFVGMALAVVGVVLAAYELAVA